MSALRDLRPAEKHPFGGDRKFPAFCRNCGNPEVILTEIEYVAEIRHDGHVCSITVPDLEISVCRVCGEKVFDEHVDRQINKALRPHLNLFTPSQIYAELGSLAISEQELAQRIGVPDETLSRWLNDIRIQPRAMDKLLRLFFALPNVRAALDGGRQDPLFGVTVNSTATSSRLAR
jgi:hypothetical protein